MTLARFQPFCRANNNNLGYFDGIGDFPRTVIEKNIDFYLYENRFCFIWKSEKTSFNQAFKEMKEEFEVVENYITEENNNSHFKYELIPKKRRSLLYTILKLIIQIELVHIVFHFIAEVN